MDIIKAFDKAFSMKEEKGWDCIYVLIDIHDTIFKGNDPENKYEWIGESREALRMMSDRNDIYMILWSGAYNYELDRYYEKLAESNILFDCVNNNPEVGSTDLYCYENKIYFNVGIDDRFGFEPESDWKDIIDYLKVR